MMRAAQFCTIDLTFWAFLVWSMLCVFQSRSFRRSQLEFQAPADPILGLVGRFKADTSEKKARIKAIPDGRKETRRQPLPCQCLT